MPVYDRANQKLRSASSCRPSRNSLGGHHKAFRGYLSGNREYSELHHGLLEFAARARDFPWASWLRRSEATQEKISGARKHFFSHRWIGSMRAISTAPIIVEKIAKKARSLSTIRRPGMNGSIWLL